MVASACQHVEDSRPAVARKRKPRLCAACAAALPKKPRSRMSLDHAVETVRAILIARLDTALEDLEAIALHVAADHIPDDGTRRALAIAFIQAAQLRLFPDEFGDGPEYTPDPAGRLDAPPVFTPLVPRRPQVSIYAKHLEAGKASAVARMTTSGKDRQGNPVTVPLFTEQDLAVLGERQERREGRAVACGI